MMTNVSIRRQYNYDYTTTFSKIASDRISQTVPDQHLTVQTIVSRYRKGLAVPRVSMVNIIEDVSQFDKLNQFERISMARDLKARADKLDADLTERKAFNAKLKSDRDHAKAVEDAVNAKLKLIKPE